jgi:hypothetical protein
MVPRRAPRALTNFTLPVARQHQEITAAAFDGHGGTSGVGTASASREQGQQGQHLGSTHGSPHRLPIAPCGRLIPRQRTVPFRVDRPEARQWQLNRVRQCPRHQSVRRRRNRL